MSYAVSRIVRIFVFQFKVQKYKFFSILKKISQTNTQKIIDNSVADDLSSAAEHIDSIDRLMPFSPDSSRFLVLCHRSDYSAGRIAQAIEDSNANVLNLNVTSDTRADDRIVVDVRVDRKNIDSIARSLARYDYIVEGMTEADDIIEERDRERVAELLRMLDV